MGESEDQQQYEQHEQYQPDGIQIESHMPYDYE
jgi:hypothetical protein